MLQRVVKRIWRYNTYKSAQTWTQYTLTNHWWDLILKCKERENILWNLVQFEWRAPVPCDPMILFLATPKQRTHPLGRHHLPEKLDSAGNDSCHGEQDVSSQQGKIVCTCWLGLQHLITGGSEPKGMEADGRSETPIISEQARETRYLQECKACGKMSCVQL